MMHVELKYIVVVRHEQVCCPLYLLPLSSHVENVFIAYVFDGVVFVIIIFLIASLMVLLLLLFLFNCISDGVIVFAINLHRKIALITKVMVVMLVGRCALLLSYHSFVRKSDELS